MPMPRKPDPLKHCAHCGTRLARKRSASGVLESLLHFVRRKYCDQKCMAQAFDAKPMKADAGWMTGHYHARKVVPPGPCAKCGKPDASDVHHKDEDYRNNSPENLVRLCRSCHMKEHNPRGSCSVCGDPVKGLGYCNRHYLQFKAGRLECRSGG